MPAPASLRVALAALLGAAVVLADRLLLLWSSGHLLFDVNQAEHGYLGAIIPWLWTPIPTIIWSPGERAAFLRDCVGVGNQVHGTLGLAGLATLWGAQLSGSLSTGLLRALALGQSTLGLLLWCRGLGAATRSAGVVAAFCLLWALGPPVFTKLTLLWWGTHDTVTLLTGLWAAVLLPWLAHPARGGAVVARGVALGALGGVLLLCNYALLMPTLGGALFWAAAHLLRGHWGRAVVGGAALAASHLATHRLILSQGVLSGLGYPTQVDSGHFLLLSGKNGGSFLHATGSGWADPARWLAEVWPIAVRQSPVAGYGAAADLAEAIVRLGAVGLGLGLLAAWLVRRRERAAAGAFLGLYLPLAAVGIGALGLGFSPDQGVHGGPVPRYFAHLYPVLMAVLAVGCAQPGRWRVPRALLLLWPLWLGAFDHARLIDRDAVRSGTAIEGAPLYFRSRPERLPPEGFSAWPGASADFVDGYAALESVQHRAYWRWLEPADLHSGDRLRDALSEPMSAQGRSSDYWRGVGAALRVLVPPQRAALLDALRIPHTHRSAVDAGYLSGGPG